VRPWTKVLTVLVVSVLILGLVAPTASAASMVIYSTPKTTYYPGRGTTTFWLGVSPTFAYLLHLLD